MDAEAGAALGQRPVDEIRDALLQVGGDRVRLRLRQLAGRHRGRELLLLGRDQGRDQARRRLAARRVSDLGERLARLELRVQLVLGQAEVRRRGVDAAEEVPVAFVRCGEDRSLQRRSAGRAAAPGRERGARSARRSRGDADDDELELAFGVHGRTVQAAVKSSLNAPCESPVTWRGRGRGPSASVDQQAAST